jgi:hypothetical protein
MTRVTGTASTLVSAPLAVGLLAAGVLAGPASAPASAGGPASRVAAPGPLGEVTAPNGTLRRGCRNYGYSYAITPPTDEWTLETFLRDRDGRSLASGTFISDIDPLARSARFRFCRWSTRPGWFTIRAHVQWYDPNGTAHDAWLDPSRFRLRRPR